MEYLISSIIGYLFGSFPTAFIIIKRFRNADIRNEGSQNVGAMNSYEVSNSKMIGLFVMIIDIAKGALSVILTFVIFGDIFILAAIAALSSVLGHCYSPWLKFKGGRGLATAAGCVAIVFPYLLVLWVVLWILFYFIKKDIHLSNIAASIMSVILVFNTSEIAIKYAYPLPESISVLILFTISGMTIILIKHVDPLIELIYSKKIFRTKRENEK